MSPKTTELTVRLTEQDLLEQLPALAGFQTEPAVAAQRADHA